jgi:hypothetical protein
LKAHHQEVSTCKQDLQGAEKSMPDTITKLPPLAGPFDGDRLTIIDPVNSKWRPLDENVAPWSILTSIEAYAT